MLERPLRGLILSVLVAALLATAYGAGGAATQETAVEGGPSIETYVWEGVVRCSYATPVVSGGSVSLGPFGCAPGGSSHQFELPVGVKTLVARMDWEPAEDSIEPDLAFSVTRLISTTTYPGGFIRSGQSHQYMHVSGQPGIGFRIDAGQHWGPNDFEHADEPWQMRFAVGAAGDANLVFEQPFTVTYELHFEDHAAPWPPAPLSERVDGVIQAGHQGAVGFTLVEEVEYFPARKGLKTVVAVLEWDTDEAFLNTDEPLSLALVRQDVLGVGWHIAGVHGTSPLVLRVDAGATGGPNDLENIETPWRVYLSISTSAWPTTVVEQPYTLHYDRFYVAHAPDDHSPVPGP